MRSMPSSSRVVSSWSGMRTYRFKPGLDFINIAPLTEIASMPVNKGISPFTHRPKGPGFGTKQGKFLQNKWESPDFEGVEEKKEKPALSRHGKNFTKISGNFGKNFV